MCKCTHYPNTHYQLSYAVAIVTAFMFKLLVTPLVTTLLREAVMLQLSLYKHIN